MSCHALLEPAAAACVECGTKVGESHQTTSAPQSGDGLQPGRNSLSFQEDRNTRKFEASLTDTAMQALGGVFGDLFAQRGAVRVPQPFVGLPAKPSVIADVGRLTAPAPVVLPGDAPVPPADVIPPAPESVPDKARVLRIFSAKGDTLELMDNRLKATNGADYLRRLTYLFLYAHECHGRMSVAERDLNIAVTTAKMMDSSGNARRWLRKRIGIADDGEDRVKLTFKGREEAVKALTAALDTGVADAWNPDKGTKGAKPAKAAKAKKTA